MKMVWGILWRMAVTLVVIGLGIAIAFGLFTLYVGGGWIWAVFFFGTLIASTAFLAYDWYQRGTPNRYR